MAGLLGRLGMTQKTDSFAEYPARSLEVAQCTLITAWGEPGKLLGRSRRGRRPCRVLLPQPGEASSGKFTGRGNARCGFRHFTGSVCRDVWDDFEQPERAWVQAGK